MTAKLALVGDRSPSVRAHGRIPLLIEALRRREGVVLDPYWIASTEAEDLDGFDGIWVVPGSPYRSAEGAIAAARTARERGIPFLGTCGGFQYAVLALVRRAGLAAAHAESEPEAEDPLIAPLACSLYGEEREVTCVPGTRLAEICGTAPFTGFHFCGFGLAAGREADLEAAGAVIAARAPDAGIEAIELPGHPFFLATLFQPQVGALEGRPRHPLVAALIAASRRSIDPRGSGPLSRGDDVDLDERVQTA